MNIEENAQITVHLLEFISLYYNKAENEVTVNLFLQLRKNLGSQPFSNKILSAYPDLSKDKDMIFYWFDNGRQAFSLSSCFLLALAT